MPAVPLQYRPQLYAAGAFAALYTLAFLHGRAAGPPGEYMHCTCSEVQRTLSVKGDLNRNEMRDIANCVLYDKPTRGILHSRLARCLGRSSWRMPGRPATAAADSSESWSSSWEDTDPDVDDSSSSSSSAYDESNVDSERAATEAQDSAAAAEAAADDGSVDEGEEEGVEAETPAAESGQVVSTSELSPDERAAKMMAAIREHNSELEGMEEAEAEEARAAAEEGEEAEAVAVDTEVFGSSSNGSSGGSSGSSSVNSSGSSSATSSGSNGGSSGGVAAAPQEASNSKPTSAAAAATAASSTASTATPTPAAIPAATTTPPAAAIATSSVAAAATAAASAAPAAASTAAAASAAAVAPAPAAAAPAAGVATTAGTAAASVATPPKRVITYSLYGKTPKYVLGAVRNAEIIGKIFPGWTARFYIDMGTVPAEVVSALRSNGAELVPIDMEKHGTQSMFWRFWAAADPTVERFISRDVDSRLMRRDAVAVAEWVKSDKGFHIVRDHPSHSNYPMSGGLWGARRGALPQVMELISRFPTDSNYLTDMNFLNKLVWPIAMDDSMQHDAFTCEEFEGSLAYPVPVDRRGHHVGQVFDEHNKGRPNDMQALLQAPQPAACRPGGDAEAARRKLRPTPLPRRQECEQMRTEHGVKVGVTWGSLQAAEQFRWQRLACDFYQK